MFKKRDAIVLVVALTLAAGIFGASRLLGGRPPEGVQAQFGEDIALESLAPALTESAGPASSRLATADSPAPVATAPPRRTASHTPMPTVTAAGAPAVLAASPTPRAYLSVSVKGIEYEPIPLDHETEFALRQKDTGAENVIHVTADSIWMASSSCDNQDCVEQGAVTLQNMNARVLENMIVCLPNEVLLALLTPEAASEVLR